MVIAVDCCGDSKSIGLYICTGGAGKLEITFPSDHQLHEVHPEPDPLCPPPHNTHTHTPAPSHLWTGPSPTLSLSVCSLLCVHCLWSQVPK